MAFDKILLGCFRTLIFNCIMQEAQGKHSSCYTIKYLRGFAIAVNDAVFVANINSAQCFFSMQVKNLINQGTVKLGSNVFHYHSKEYKYVNLNCF